MKINEKIIDFRIEPYIEEATMQLMLEIIIVSLVATLMVIAQFPLIYLACFAIVYSVLSLVFNYRVVIQAITDKRKKECVTEIVSVKCFREEYSFVYADSLGHSYLHRKYPKDMNVQKYKIKVIDSNGEEKKLRSVMSFRRMTDFVFFDDFEYLKVAYLKRSRILINVELVEELDKKTSKKDKRNIEKALHFINTSV